MLDLIKENLIDILFIIFFLWCLLAMIIGSIIHNKKRKEIKEWKIKSIKIKGTIKSTEYIRWVNPSTFLENNQIDWRYITVEALDPFTNKKKIYDSEKYSYPSKFFKSIFSSFKRNKKERESYIKNKNIIGTSVDIIINKENPKIYYIQEPKKEILDKNHNHIW